MKKLLLFSSLITTLGLAPAFAQLGHASGPHIGGAMSKLFGANQTFSATMEFQAAGPNGANITMPGKFNFDNGRARFEITMSERRGANLSADTLAHMKSMGMDSMISITRPDQKLIYIIYPGLTSFVAMTPQEKSDAVSPDDFKVETTELGKETIDGHACVKDKVIVTDKDGNQQESTVWNATDLKNFPIKIETMQAGQAATMLFKNISFAKPDAGLFDPPANYTKYNSPQAMMQAEMMKRMGSGMATPPAQN